MEPILQKLAEQTPSTVAVIIVVVLFIRFIATERRTNQEFLKEVHSDNLEARNLTRAALDRNAEALSENIRITSRNTDTLERLARAMERQEIKKHA